MTSHSRAAIHLQGVPAARKHSHSAGGCSKYVREKKKRRHSEWHGRRIGRSLYARWLRGEGGGVDGM